MRLFFSVLSLAYIAGIFLLADSPIVSSLAPFNPYSLFHIPLYAVLTILLILSILPFKIKHNNPINQRDQKDQRDQIDQRDQRNRFLVAGLIAFGVSIADEIYQSFIPGRDASFTDVFLDLLGITLVSFLFFKLYKEKKAGIAFQPNE